MSEDEPGPGQSPDDQTELEEQDLESEDDEFDPFAAYHVDPPPKDQAEGDDRVHGGA